MRCSMDSNCLALYQHLRDFHFGPLDARLTFCARLARENGWTENYAQRVVEEYRKFLVLAATGTVPVTPSDEVDQAWHLHLAYTESYWNDLCRDVLGKPLHHGPTRGGARQNTKFRELYDKTLARCGFLLVIKSPLQTLTSRDSSGRSGGTGCSSGCSSSSSGGSSGCGGCGGGGD